MAMVENSMRAGIFSSKQETTSMLSKTGSLELELYLFNVALLLALGAISSALYQL